MPGSTAISIGAFDGVHLGHRRLLSQARSAVGAGGTVRAITFDPFPLAVLAPDRAPGRLTTIRERIDLLQSVGADEVVVLDPRTGLLEMSAESFIEWLQQEHDPAVIVEGPDFRFGHRRRGDLDLLRAKLEPGGVRVIEAATAEAVLSGQQIVPVSSTLVRRLLGLGRTRDAAALLGRNFSITAEVVPGDRRGRTIGFPTANLETGDRLLPADGVYAGSARVPGGGLHPAAISVGTKPSFGHSRRTCEVHLLEYEGPVDAYGWSMELRFGDWLRPQFVYSVLEDLLAQIRRDCRETARRVEEWV